MADFIGNIWTFKTAQFKVSVDAYHDYAIDLNFDRTGEVAKKLNSGEYISFYVKATLSDSQEHGLAYAHLGSCIYSDIKDFKDNVGINKSKNCGSNFSDMVRTVLHCGRKEIWERHNLYTAITNELRY